MLVYYYIMVGSMCSIGYIMVGSSACILLYNGGHVLVLGYIMVGSSALKYIMVGMCLY